MKKTVLIPIVIIVGVLFLLGCTKSTAGSTFKEGTPTMVLYKSEMCGCCELFGQYMKKMDYGVEVKQMDDITPIKDQYKIPQELRSCHTAVIEGYFVEGHIPPEAIAKLLTEKPAIAGIAMPGMPSGSPGMPGAKTGEFVIYAVDTEGNVSEFMRI